MSSDADEKIDEVANDLDELETTVEEVGDDPGASANPNTIDRLKDALEHARDAADDLEDDQKP